MTVRTPMLVCAAATMLLAAFSHAGWSQTRVEISGAPTCPSCRVKMTPVATLGRARDAELITAPGAVVRDSRGWFYVADRGNRDMVLAYDATGKYRARVGTTGSGPGEFLSVVGLAIDRGDSLHVFGSRETVFAPDGKFARTRVFEEAPYTHGGLVFADGTLLLHATIASPTRGDNPFHVLGPGRGITRSFGTNPTPRYKNPYTNFRRLAPASAQDFWAAEIARYRIELWTSDGQMTRLFERRVDWFPVIDPVAAPTTDDRIMRPIPTVSGISLDGAGTLWVLVSVADANWKPTGTAPPPGREQPARPNSLAERALVYDAMIEAIEARTGKLLVSQRVPNLFRGFAGPGLAVELIEDTDGVISIRVVKLEIDNR